MPPLRLLLVTPCVAALVCAAGVCAAGAAMAAKQDGRNVGHLPRVSTATYSRPASSHARVRRMAGVHGARYAWEHHRGLVRES